MLAPTASYGPCIGKMLRPNCEVATLFSSCSPLNGLSLLHVCWGGCYDTINTYCTAENLVDNTRRMYAAPCWAPHFFKLAKDNDGWCTPTHSARDMAATVAALRDAQFLSDSTLDFLKRCFLTHESPACLSWPEHSLSQLQSQAICHLCQWA